MGDGQDSLIPSRYSRVSPSRRMRMGISFCKGVVSFLIASNFCVAPIPGAAIISLINLSTSWQCNCKGWQQTSNCCLCATNWWIPPLTEESRTTAHLPHNQQAPQQPTLKSKTIEADDLVSLCHQNGVDVRRGKTCSVNCTLNGIKYKLGKCPLGLCTCDACVELERYNTILVMANGNLASGSTSRVDWFPWR